MIRTFNPGFTIIQPDYVSGRSGGGVSGDIGTVYTDNEWFYIYVEDGEDIVPNFGSAGWYRYKLEDDLPLFDESWYGSAPPDGAVPYL